MNFEKLTPRLKLQILEDAVLYGTPEEVSEIYKQLGEMPFTARALGYACRYRGLETVKALVECGASFAYDVDEVNRLYRRDPFDNEFGETFEFYSVMLLNSFNYFLFKGVNCIELSGRKKMPELLFFDDRREILEYLCNEPQKTGFDMNELLYYAYLAGEPEMVSMLIAHNAVFSDRRKNFLAKTSNITELDNFYERLILYSDRDFVPTFLYFKKEMGGYKPPVTRCLLYRIKENCPWEMFYEFLGIFDLHFIGDWVWKTITGIINNNDLDEISKIMKAGLIQRYNECRELIDYSVKRKKTECTAALLEYLHRNFNVEDTDKNAPFKQIPDLDDMIL